MAHKMEHKTEYMRDSLLALVKVVEMVQLMANMLVPKKVLAKVQN